MLSRSDLHWYQNKLIEFAHKNPKCAFFVDMGFGKTISSLTVISDNIQSHSVSKVLIVAPLRVANSVWHTEIANWKHINHLSYSICTGTELRRKEALKKEADIYIINRENIVWLVELYKQHWPFDMVVIDESSSFKNHATKRFKAFKKVLPYIDKTILLTGTPTPNGLLDLWSQLFILDRGERLGRTISAFRNRWFVTDWFGYNYEPRPFAEKQIHHAIADVTINVKIPKYNHRIDIVRAAKLPVKLMKQYLAFRNQFVMELSKGVIEATTAATLSNKMLQFCNGAIYDEDKHTHQLHDIKIDMLKEVVEETQGENLLIAYNYKSDLAKLKKHFPDAQVLDKDPETIERWNRGEIGMLLAHPASAGHGLNLQKGGSIIIWFGLTWSLELYQQFVARLDRQGQKDTVRNIHLTIEDSIDNDVMQAISSKATTQKELMEFLKKKYVK